MQMHALLGWMQTLLSRLILQVGCYALLVGMCCGVVGGDVAATCFIALHENPNDNNAASHPPPPRPSPSNTSRVSCWTLPAHPPPPPPAWHVTRAHLQRVPKCLWGWHHLSNAAQPCSGRFPATAWTQQ